MPELDAGGFEMVGRKLARLAAVLTLGAAAACTDTTGGAGTATVTVRLTDAPSEYISSATVEIGKISLIPADGSAPVVLTDNGGTYDLMTLQNGVTADLATLSIEPGTYSQLRMVVTSATVTLIDGFAFPDGGATASLKVPSGAQSGIKVNLAGADGGSSGSGLAITQGQTILLVDFDVSQNFVLQGNPTTPAGIKGVIFTPLLRAVATNVAGSIAGSVTSSADGTPVADAVVHAKLLDSDVLQALQTDEATGTTDQTGAYLIQYLAPGTYEVSVENFSAEPDTITVGAGAAVTGIDFTGTVETP
jgi:hypothetical protein